MKIYLNYFKSKLFKFGILGELFSNSNKNRKKYNYLKYADKSIRTLTYVLTAIGFLILFSATTFSSFQKGTWLPFNLNLLKQFVGIVVGIFLMRLLICVDFDFYKKHATTIFLWFAIFTLSVLFIGTRVNGAKRWIHFASFTVQPSEFGKIGIVLYFALYLFIVKNHINSLISFVNTKYRKMFVGVTFLLPIVVYLGIVFKEPDLGTSILNVIILFSMLLTYQYNRKTTGQLYLTYAIVGVVIFLFFATPLKGMVFQKYQLTRLTAFTDPFKYRLDIGYQIISSLVAVANGGIFGRGIGNGIQKLGLLPESDTDFIFSTVSEEFGLVFTLGVLIIFFVLFFRTLRAISKITDPFSKSIATGLIFIIIVNVILNLGGMSGSMPLTGVPLPFFSYGMSSTITHLVCIGIIQGAIAQDKRGK